MLNGVGLREASGNEDGVREDRAEGRVVGLVVTELAIELVLERNVLRLEGEDHNRVRKANVEARLGGHVLEWRGLCLLNLVDQDIARGITHLDTLVIVDDGVVSERLNVVEVGMFTSSLGDESRRRSRIVVLDNIANVYGAIANTKTGVNHNELFPVTEVVGDLNVIEREGGNGERNARVLTEEEGKRAAEVATSDSGSGADGEGERADHTNHVQVPLTLAAGATPFKVVVEPVGIEFLNDEIVELNLNVADEVVH